MCRWGNDRTVRLNKPREVSGKTEVLVDACIATLVQMLNDFGVCTTGSCCGHGYQGNEHHGSIEYEQDGERFSLKVWPNGHWAKAHSQEEK